MKNFKYKNLLNYQIDDWSFVLKFIPEIDFEKTHLHFETEITPFKFTKKIKYCIISTGFEETPRFAEIEEWCKKNSNCLFLLLGDFELNDYHKPENLIFIEYRFFYLELAQILEHYKNFTLVANKNIKYKFSSLSFKERELRAIITAQLFTFAKEQSLISYHNEKNWDYEGDDKHYNDIDHQLIQIAAKSKEFASLNWNFLKDPLKIDGFNTDKNDILENIFDISMPAYSESLINFSNETFCYGVYLDENGNDCIRPSPYISEKTWKPLLSGCILINVAQPNMYKFLKEKYHIPINYSIDMSYDNELFEYERMQKIQELIINLVDTPISVLLDQNIECCKNIQDTLLSKNYIQQFEIFNENQDKAILDIINS